MSCNVAFYVVYKILKQQNNLAFEYDPNDHFIYFECDLLAIGICLKMIGDLSIRSIVWHLFH